MLLAQGHKSGSEAAIHAMRNIFDTDDTDAVLLVDTSNAFNALGPVVEKPTNANPRLRINQGVYFSTPKCFSTLIFGKTLH